MFGLGLQELLIVGVVAVVLFGKRLPEVAKSLGSSYREFRQGLGEIQSQMDFTSYSYSRTNRPSYPSPSAADEPEDYDQPTAPKFELPMATETAASEPAAKNPSR